MRLNNNPSSLESVRGHHNGGLSNSDVGGLWVMDDVTELSRLPKNIERFFPTLIVLFWDNGNLRSITADDLQPFPELRLFAVFQNNLISIDGALFQHTRKLNYIDLASNRIDNVGSGLLDNLNELIELDFSLNSCINANATTPQGIQLIKQKLSTYCATLTETTQVTATTSRQETTATTSIRHTTTDHGSSTSMQPPPPVAPPIDICSIRCSVNEEVDELYESLRLQGETIIEQRQSIMKLQEENDEQFQIKAKMQETINNQKDLMVKNEKRIDELENSNAKSEERIEEIEKQLREILAMP